MDTPSTIRLLEADSNKRGDLFTRLTGDLFFALGYGDLRFDVHKSGRELDIQGRHRTDPRLMIAECKAHQAKMGGADMNKLLGALTRERSRDKQTPISGYFVSLAGFSEPGRDQESETPEQERLVLIGGKKLIEELINSRVVVDLPMAAAAAGRCIEHAGVDGVVLESAELLGHEHGYIWGLTFSRNKQPTYLALIHANGDALGESIAKQILDSDRQCDGDLRELNYLAAPNIS